MVSDEIITAIIGAAVPILVVGLSYVSSKNKEINAHIRQKKQEMYEGLVETLTAVGQSLYENKENMDAFILAYNKASPYASDEVVDACQTFFIHLMNNKKDDGLLVSRINGIYDAIRKDVNPEAKSFKFQLYTAQATSQQEQEQQRQQQQQSQPEN